MLIDEETNALNDREVDDSDNTLGWKEKLILAFLLVILIVVFVQPLLQKVLNSTHH